MMIFCRTRKKNKTLLMDVDTLYSNRVLLNHMIRRIAIKMSAKLRKQVAGEG